MDAVIKVLEHCPCLGGPYSPVETARWEETDSCENEKLNKGIAEFYDEGSSLCEDLWSDHLHHGFYDINASVSEEDPKAAQVRTIEESLAFAGIADNPEKKPKSIVDVGCGLGGCSRYLAKKFGANAWGITLSPAQAERANALAAAEGLADKASFQVADALDQPFPDGKFDLVWSIESAQHMPDKSKFVGELARVAAPGATIIIVTFCHRNLSPGEDSLKPEEKRLLNKIGNAHFMPDWCSASDYVKMARSLGLVDIKTADWSDNIAPFWPVAIRSMLTWQGFASLFRSGWKTTKGALAVPLMMKGYNKNLVKYEIIICRKPK